MKANFEKHTLKFKFDAGTSRGILKEKETWFIKLSSNNNVWGIGECGPLKGLSPELDHNFEEYLASVVSKLSKIDLPSDYTTALELAERIISPDFPSIRFGLETALLDLLNGGRGIVYDNDFSRGLKEIPINGLIWMGDVEFMKHQLKEKISQGYTCIKLKIGSIEFKEEQNLLELLRKEFDSNIILRVDANGAFSFDEAKQKLPQLAQFNLHSIEQPIKPGQWNEMKELIRLNYIPIALDEELIGITDSFRKKTLLEQLNPPFIILKPTLTGGLKSTQEWITLAEERDIGWWITSALESNIGLNAIAQFTAGFSLSLHQGLGTGQLYTNNIPSALVIENGFLRINREDNQNSIFAK